MRRILPAILLAATTVSAAAQVPVTVAPDQAALLVDKDPHLAANKKLVFDFWRTVLVAGHLDRAAEFMTPEYIQHNPNVPTGRAAFVERFGKLPKKDVPAAIPALVSIVAGGDLVVLSFRDEQPDPRKPGSTYTTTRFDMFRGEGGKVAEHWDDMRVGLPGPPPGQ